MGGYLILVKILRLLYWTGIELKLNLDFFVSICILPLLILTAIRSIQDPKHTRKRHGCYNL
jgi:uncharacterized membrane protein